MLDPNPNVPTTVKTPDTYIYISTTPVTPGTPLPNNLFVVAPFLNSAAALTGAPYSLTAGTAQPNSVQQYTSVASINAAFGRRSLAAARARAALQSQPAGINVIIPAINEPTASNFSGVKTQLLTFGGTVAGSGQIKIRICGDLHLISAANGDAAATLATTALAALGGVGGGTNPQQPNCPMVPGAIISSTTLPLVFVHRGEVGNDSPIIVDIPPEITGVTISPGQTVITTTSVGASAASSRFTVRCGSQAVNVAIPVSTTPTDAAKLIVAAVNAATFGLSATETTGTITWYYRNGWAVHRIQIASTEDAGGQTYTLADRLNATHAAIDTSTATTAGVATFTGLQGSGVPTLTTMLSNKAKFGPCKEWFCEYLDSTSLNAIYGHITSQYANGYYQYNERVTLGSSEVLDTTGTGLKNAKQRITDPSPALTNDWRYGLLASQDCFSQAGALAVSLAADLTALALPYNIDGHALTQGNDVQILGPRSDTDLDPTTTDTAMRSYFLMVAHSVNGKVVVVRGVTTWGASNTEWADLSYGRMFDESRYQLRAHLNNRFNGKVLFTATSPRVQNAFTLDDVEDAVMEWLMSQDGRIVDGAKSLRQFVHAEVDPTDGTYIRIAYRLRPPREAHVKAGTVSSAPPVA